MANLQSMNEFTYNSASIHKERSTFKKNPTLITTLKAGDIVPIYCTSTIPGSTFKIDLSYILRMLTPAVPVMDTAYIDTYAFWESLENLSHKYHIVEDEDGNMADFSQLCGENKTGYWAESKTYKFRKINIKNIRMDDTLNEKGIAPQSVMNYLGLPICYDSLEEGNEENNITNENTGEWPELSKVNDIKINIYEECLLDHIYNEWFRNENVKAPTLCLQEKAENIEKITYDWATQDGWGSSKDMKKYPYKANIIGGYFESNLPEPIKTQEQFTFNLGTQAPVEINGLESKLYIANNTKQPYSDNTQVEITNPNQTSSEKLTNKANGEMYLEGWRNVFLGTQLSYENATADLTNATSLTIDDLRQAIAIQHMEEKLARSGSRYIEFLQAFYGVHPSNRVLERPEYLGGQRTPINVSQVVQVADTDQSEMGQLGAYSYTAEVANHLVNKSFDEWGLLMIVVVIRTKNKYFQGIPREMSKEFLTDLFIPELENIGDQATHTKELDIFNGETEEDVFGYQERYAEYKNDLDHITGYATPGIDPILGLYNYQTQFEGKPYLNEDFETQQYEKIAKVLYESKTLAQFIMNTAFDITMTAPMKMYSIPGLERI